MASVIRRLACYRSEALSDDEREGDESRGRGRFVKRRSTFASTTSSSSSTLINSIWSKGSGDSSRSSVSTRSSSVACSTSRDSRDGILEQDACESSTVALVDDGVPKESVGPDKPRISLEIPSSTLELNHGFSLDIRFSNNDELSPTATTPSYGSNKPDSSFLSDTDLNNFESASSSMHSSSIITPNVSMAPRTSPGSSSISNCFSSTPVSAQFIQPTSSSPRSRRLSIGSIWAPLSPSISATSTSSLSSRFSFFLREDQRELQRLKNRRASEVGTCASHNRHASLKRDSGTRSNSRDSSSSGGSPGSSQVFSRRRRLSLFEFNSRDRETDSSAAQDRGVTPKNLFAKVWRYQNSRVPAHKPPFKVYPESYSLLTLAAKHSSLVYTSPSAVPATSATRVFNIKAVAQDHTHNIVIAIRGTKRFHDWAVNFRHQGASPTGFLADEGNLCHAGFLDIARNMIGPVAKVLRGALKEKAREKEGRRRPRWSLVLTGHSAGGAVASLLYAHMEQESDLNSELRELASRFRRVHCVTFGTPPTSLLPLSKPVGKRHDKNLFVSFVNEGDPVARADPSMLRSLLALYHKAAPKAGTVVKWNVPTGGMCLPGRIVVLRVRPGSSAGVLAVKDVEAVMVEDADMRKLVFGDPLAHQMVLYENRIKELAIRAVTSEGY